METRLQTSDAGLRSEIQRVELSLGGRMDKLEHGQRWLQWSVGAVLTIMLAMLMVMLKPYL